MFRIRFDEAAVVELEALRRSDRVRIVDAVERSLSEEPTTPTRQRKMLLGLVAPWEQVGPVWQLRVGDFRVFYDVDEHARVATVKAVRHKGRRTTEEIL